MLKIFFENEVIMLFLGIGVLVFSIGYRKKIKKICLWKNLMLGFYFLLIAWIFTVAEGLIFADYFNLAEHICYLLSAILIFIWILRIQQGKFKRVC